MFIWFRKPRYMYYTLLCNLLTNPAMNLVLLLLTQYFGPAVYLPALVMLEIAVVLAEAFVLAYLTDFRFRKAFLVSLVLNASSYFAGMLINLI